MVSSVEVTAATPPPPSYQLQSMLQAAVQSVQWTYSLFWQLCPQRGMLVWGDGYYNGAIKTRKTVQPVEVSTEEASLQRSEQLRELYEALSAGESNQPVKRPSAALSPEDLTESEWYYLMCVSFSFPPGVGLPGKAYVKQQHVWLTGANEVDSKVFSRAILAKSARVQTVLCIPILHGIVELGTTDKVHEDLEFVNRVKSFFIGVLLPPAKPALSGHSTSNNTTISHTVVYAVPEPPADGYHDEGNDEEDEPNDYDDDDEEDDDDDEEEEERELLGALLESEAEVETPHTQTTVIMAHNQEANMVAIDNDYHQPSHHELMQLDLSEDIRFGSPDDGSENLGSDFRLLGVNQITDQINPKWPDLHNHPSHNLHLHQAQGTPRLEELSDEDTHYSQTVSTILLHQSTKCSDQTLTPGYSIHPNQSAFSTWITDHRHQNHRLFLPATDIDDGVSSQQRLLKYIVFTVPSLHHSAAKSTDGRKGTSQDELSANHVLAERRRREKLNERFIILRSLVPVVTKMDKASILGDTIEYVKQLRKKIQDLEARARHMEIDQVVQKRKKPKALEAAPPHAAPGDVVQVEVSIIESDALVELQCPYREGLLFDVMKKLRELGVEIRTVQSSLNNGICAAEMRAKVKESANGKKLSIMEVKKAINQIIPSSR